MKKKISFSDLEMNFSWITNFENQEIIFNFHFNKTLTKDQYFLIGFMKQKQIFGSDFCLFKDGTVAVSFIFYFLPKKNFFCRMVI